jgi:hypothetical protein
MMSFKIYSADDLPEADWSILTSGSFFSSPGFIRIWRTAGGRDVFFLRENQDRPEAGLAGVIFGRGFLARFQSAPDGLYGGPFFAAGCPDSTRRDFLRVVCDWMKDKRILRADIHNPQEPLNMEPMSRVDTFCHTVRLSEHYLDTIPRKVRKHIDIGKRRGGIIARMDDLKYLDAFYDLVVATEKRHRQKPRYTYELFKALFELSLADDRIIWPIMLAGDRIVASRIGFIERSQIFSWQYFSDREHNSLKPNYLLMDSVINCAAARGTKILNLGWSPPEAASLIEFKESWGGQLTPVPNYIYMSRLGKIIYKWRRG